jgi:hypothetical protein
MATVAQRCHLDGMEDFGGGAEGARGDCGGSRDRSEEIILPAGLRGCEKKEAICKGLVPGVIVAGERAQAARGLGRVDQPAIGADLEDETVRESRGRGADARTEEQDERKGVVRSLRPEPGRSVPLACGRRLRGARGHRQ